MKKYIQHTILTLFTLPVLGQIKNIKIDTLTTLERMYLGMGGNQVFKVDTAFNVSTLRLGTILNQDLNDKFRIGTTAVLKLETSNKVKSAGAFDFTYLISSKSKLRIGYLATAITEIRPNPTTPESQTEFNSQSKIPGAQPTIKYSFNKTNTSFSSSLSYSNKLLGGQIKVDHKFLSIGFHLDKASIMTAMDVKIKSVRIISVNLWKNQMFAQTVSYNFTRYFVYLDSKIKAPKWEDIEVGGRRYFNNENIFLKGFIRLSINFIPKTVTGGLFLYLDK
ncbi:hypothetical protein [Flavobacterium sedimenticola]|uniref:Uncharacterized protein n=1 Tax=Flavobacterium sedimenticola TaxID=3043286 RepID=A0ABT6XS94_9FLAO|nr:hypothetical protein [Flavobacterium sedimenticola]MDI9257931.1 hypothetical protein [Flavobacterium sedimenticola]